MKGKGRKVMVLCFFFFLCPLSSFAFPLSSFESGYQLYKQGRLPAAEAAFQKAALDDHTPADWNLWFLSVVQLERGETDLALLGLDQLSKNENSVLRFDALLKASEILLARGQRWSAAGNILAMANDPNEGAKAMFHAGNLVLAASDTAEAFRIWHDLHTRFPRSPYAHRAVLRILESGESLAHVDEYLLLAMARASFTSIDYLTSASILESLARRRIDRRLRDDVLLLHGDVLFKQSRYQDALSAYREARFLTDERDRQKKAYAGMIQSRLYMGENIRSDILRKLEVDGEPILVETLETVAALRRARGDIRGSEEILSLTDVPTFERFLQQSCVPEEALRLSDREDRSLALALLAENCRDAELWRSAIFETNHDYLLQKATEALKMSSESEASARYDVALDALIAGDSESAMRHFRVVKYGYPSTNSSKLAHQKMQGLIRPFFDSDLERHPAAKTLSKAGAFNEAAVELRDKTGAFALHVEMLAKAGLFSEAITQAEEYRSRLPWPVALQDLPQSFQKILYPTPYAALFRKSADSFRVDAGTLSALARVQTQFNPSFHSGFRLGIAAMDLEAIEFAKGFNDAPQIQAEELLLAAKAIPMSAWFLKFLSKNLDETRPYRLAGAISSGIGNLPAKSRSTTELQWISELPFRNSRRFVMDFIVAYRKEGERGKAQGARQ